MVRMVMETRPDPRLGLHDESALDVRRQGRTGMRQTMRTSRKTSRAARSPSQQFASRIFWRDITQAELRQHQRSAGLREAMSLSRGLVAEGASAQQHGADTCGPNAEAGSSDVNSRPAGPLTLNTLLTRAVDSHVQSKLDERIAAEWEVVPDVPEADEYVLL